MSQLKRTVEPSGNSPALRATADRWNYECSMEPSLPYKLTGPLTVKDRCLVE